MCAFYKMSSSDFFFYKKKYRGEEIMTSYIYIYIYKLLIIKPVITPLDIRRSILVITQGQWGVIHSRQ